MGVFRLAIFAPPSLYPHRIIRPGKPSVPCTAAAQYRTALEPNVP